MKLALIVARAQNGVIGINNKLPWHLPNDLQYFKQVTMGKPIIMGRKTWESIGRPLPGRKNIVITRMDGYQVPEGVAVVASLQQAVDVAEAELQIMGGEEAVIIGGAQIYQECLPMVDRLYITEVHAEIDGDAFFPEVDLQTWRKTAEETHPSCEKNPYEYSFQVFER